MCPTTIIFAIILAMFGFGGDLTALFGGLLGGAQ